MTPVLVEDRFALELFLNQIVQDVRRTDEGIDILANLIDGQRSVRSDLAAVKRREGPRLLDLMVEIIRDHGPSGAQSASEVHLELE